MNSSNKLLLLLSFCLLILLLSGCMGDKASETLTINNIAGYEGVLVSGASSMVENSGYEETLVSGEGKANALIDILNGKELVEASEQELQDRRDDLEEPGNYRMLLYNEPSVNSTSEDFYLLLFYKDGTIQVNQEGNSYFIADPPKDLLSKLKSDWEITF
ncbi:hypothetical protein QOZ98_002141 [Planomicrobium stackebrandtii]|uniref:Lipoprotein n=1 Tax=Planomicrobium stackebrandtii TaxID=253160 RepID=A0ABU0GVI2_9BACL|nr:hypothetical protein [Planomicrobium stackebrandtii]MDQ0429313.1 hypothetical protein [Planomicrobium stackebrandtii]